MNTLNELYCEIAHEHDYDADPVCASVELLEPCATPETVLTAAERAELEQWFDTLDAAMVEVVAA